MFMNLFYHNQWLNIDDHTALFNQIDIIGLNRACVCRYCSEYKTCDLHRGGKYIICRYWECIGEL